MTHHATSAHRRSPIGFAELGTGASVAGILGKEYLAQVLPGLDGRTLSEADILTRARWSAAR